jgi:hypothetical protein
MNPETKTMSSFPASEEIVWLRALHAVELCQEVAEAAARSCPLRPPSLPPESLRSQRPASRRGWALLA